MYSKANAALKICTNRITRPTNTQKPEQCPGQSRYVTMGCFVQVIGNKFSIGDTRQKLYNFNTSANSPNC